jgi:hypothetical protein
MSKLVEETVHAQIGPGPLQRDPDRLVAQCIAHALYRQAPGDDVVWDLTVTFSPNIIRPTTCVCASICVADPESLRLRKIREYALRFLVLHA